MGARRARGDSAFKPPPESRLCRRYKLDKAHGRITPWSSGQDAGRLPLTKLNRAFRPVLAELSESIGTQVLLVRRDGASLQIVDTVGESLTAPRLGAGFRVGFGGLCAGGVVIGMTYGAFLLETRDYSSAGARNYGRQSLVSLFNNIGNISSLVAFGILSALAAVRATSSASAMFLVLVAVIGLLPIAGVPFLMLAARPDRGAASRGA